MSSPLRPERRPARPDPGQVARGTLKQHLAGLTGPAKEAFLAKVRAALSTQLKSSAAPRPEAGKEMDPTQILDLLHRPAIEALLREHLRHAKETTRGPAAEKASSKESTRRKAGDTMKKINQILGVSESQPNEPQLMELFTRYVRQYRDFQRLVARSGALKKEKPEGQSERLTAAAAAIEAAREAFLKAVENKKPLRALIEFHQALTAAQETYRVVRSEVAPETDSREAAEKKRQAEFHDIPFDKAQTGPRRGATFRLEEEAEQRQRKGRPRGRRGEKQENWRTFQARRGETSQERIRSQRQQALQAAKRLRFQYHLPSFIAETEREQRRLEKEIETRCKAVSEAVGNLAQAAQPLLTFETIQDIAREIEAAEKAEIAALRPLLDAVQALPEADRIFYNNTLHQIADLKRDIKRARESVMNGSEKARATRDWKEGLGTYSVEFEDQTDPFRYLLVARQGNKLILKGEAGREGSREIFEWKIPSQSAPRLPHGLTVDLVRALALGRQTDVDQWVFEAEQALETERQEKAEEKADILQTVKIDNLPVHDLRFFSERIHGKKGERGPQLVVYYGHPRTQEEKAQGRGQGKWALRAFRPGDELPEGLERALPYATDAEKFLEAWNRLARKAN